MEILKINNFLKNTKKSSFLTFCHFSQVACVKFFWNSSKRKSYSWCWNVWKIKKIVSTDFEIQVCTFVVFFARNFAFHCVISQRHAAQILSKTFCNPWHLRNNLWNFGVISIIFRRERAVFLKIALPIMLSGVTTLNWGQKPSLWGGRGCYEFHCTDTKFLPNSAHVIIMHPAM